MSADAISGERERGTLEALLVTPVGRRHIVVGKLLAATTMWMASLVVVLPLVLVMADGPGVVRRVRGARRGRLPGCGRPDRARSRGQFAGHVQSRKPGGVCHDPAAARRPQPAPGSQREHAGRLGADQGQPGQRRAHPRRQRADQPTALVRAASLPGVAHPRRRRPHPAGDCIVRSPRARGLPMRRLMLAVGACLLTFTCVAAPAAQADRTVGDVTVRIDPPAASIKLGESLDLQITVTNQGKARSPPLVLHLDVTDPSRSTSVDPEDWTSTLSKRVGASRTR